MSVAAISRVRAGRAALVLLLASASTASACARKKDVDTSRDASATVAPTVPVPAGALAFATWNAPDAFWGDVQDGVKGLVGLLPRQALPVVFAAFDLDPELARAIDGREPCTGALGLDESRPTFAVACVAKDVARLAHEAGPGDAAGGAVPGFRRLVSRSGPSVMDASDAGDAGAAPGPVFATGPRSEIVVASSTRALEALGPYVAFTLLPKARLPNAAPEFVAEVPPHALEDVAVPALLAAWERALAELRTLADDAKREHGGREPDYGDPATFLGAMDAFVRARIDAVRSFGAVHVRVAPAGTGLVATVRGASDARAEPRQTEASDGPATPSVVARTRAHVPDDAVIAYVGPLDDAVRVLVERPVREPDAERARSILARWNGLRSDTVGVAVALDDGARFDLWSLASPRGAVGAADGGDVDGGVVRLARLVRPKPFVRPLALASGVRDGIAFVRLGRRVAPELTPEAPPAPGSDELDRVLDGAPSTLAVFEPSRLRGTPFAVLAAPDRLEIAGRGVGAGASWVARVPFSFLRVAVEASRGP